MAGSPTIGDVYELVDVQALRGQQVLNVYFYQVRETFVTTRPTIAEVLANNWTGQILPDLTAVQTEDLVHTSVRVRNLYNAADTFELLMSAAGDDSNPTDSNFDAYPFQMQGETHAVRKGAKRIAGVSDGANADGIVTDPATLALLDSIATSMSAPVQVGTLILTDTFFPVLVKRVRSGVAGAYEYRLPETSGEGVVTTIINVLFDVLISTQNSRKIGRGA